MKIGITTHYYKSNNYGGNFQAYALCKILSKYGYEAEQICFNRRIEKKTIKQKLQGVGFFGLIKKIVIGIVNRIKRKNKSIKKQLIQISKREQHIFEFNNKIPHSTIVYTQDNIVEANLRYDFFITGSDQVWNPDDLNCAYSLEFVKDKPKISYAASISRKQLTEEQKENFKIFLKSYKAVSVREKNAVTLLQDISPVDVSLALDPTLLLSKTEWEGVLEDCEIETDYIFCYFLGNDKKVRKISKEIARNKGLKIVDIPSLQGGYESADKNFADINVTTASPGQLLALIKNAKYILTDSFHATVFSFIFEKEFFVFERIGQSGMGVRIHSLLELLNLPERFFDNLNEFHYQDIQEIEKIDYGKEFLEFEKARKESLQFLFDNIG